MLKKMMMNFHQKYSPETKRSRDNLFKIGSHIIDFLADKVIQAIAHISGIKKIV